MSVAKESSQFKEKPTNTDEQLTDGTLKLQDLRGHPVLTSACNSSTYRTRTMNNV